MSHANNIYHGINAKNASLFAMARYCLKTGLYCIVEVADRAFNPAAYQFGWHDSSSHASVR